MDKGLSTREMEDMLSVSRDYIDVVKFGFGTSIVSPNIEQKMALLKLSDIPFYFGGTLFEAFVVRNEFDRYLDLLYKYEVPYVEVSDGSLEMPHEAKCKYINLLAEKGFTVWSEIGSKDHEKIMPPYIWIKLMDAELEAGSAMLIAEARESGTVGIYRGTGEVRSGLVEEILHSIPREKILWEAPQKKQQVWFIKLLDQNVNLGNIAPNDIIPLETLRLGLRGDTFSDFLPEDMKTEYMA